VLGPGQLQRDPVGDRPQPVVAVVALGDVGLEAHLPDLVDRPRGQAVAAGLVPREGLALQHADVMAGLGQPEPGGAPGRPPADDEDVVAVGGHTDQA
jgi:hypothetical protein